MKTNKQISYFKKPVAIFAAIALCVCFCVTAALASTGVRQGFFIDITDNNGAITGTAYEAAADEILIDAAVDGESLIVQVLFSDPGKLPYSASEKLSIAQYCIVDAKGQTVTEGVSTDAVDVADGTAELVIPADSLNDGSYRLIVTAFTSEKKADQPLNIYGVWECGFVK